MLFEQLVAGRGRGDGGQALPLLVVVLLATAAVLLAATEIAPMLNDAARAQTAADAAALAAAAEGVDSAHRLAAANGAVVEEVAWIGRSVQVRVRVGRATATARAVGTVVWVPR